MATHQTLELSAPSSTSSVRKLRCRYRMSASPGLSGNPSLLGDACFPKNGKPLGMSFARPDISNRTCLRQPPTKQPTKTSIFTKFPPAQDTFDMTLLYLLPGVPKLSLSRLGSPSKSPTRAVNWNVKFLIPPLSTSCRDSTGGQQTKIPTFLQYYFIPNWQPRCKENLRKTYPTTRQPTVNKWHPLNEEWLFKAFLGVLCHLLMVSVFDSFARHSSPFSGLSQAS